MYGGYGGVPMAFARCRYGVATVAPRGHHGGTRSRDAMATRDGDSTMPISPIVVATPRQTGVQNNLEAHPLAPLALP